MRRILLASLALAVMAGAGEARDRSVPQQFQHQHPCPSTGKTTGACPGYVRDHIVPLCRSGADSTSNMQWQTIAGAKAKDRWECK
jgi:hypothetical protein